MNKTSIFQKEELLVKMEKKIAKEIWDYWIWLPLKTLNCGVGEKGMEREEPLPFQPPSPVGLLN